MPKYEIEPEPVPVLGSGGVPIGVSASVVDGCDDPAAGSDDVVVGASTAGGTLEDVVEVVVDVVVEVVGGTLEDVEVVDVAGETLTVALADRTRPTPPVTRF